MLFVARWAEESVPFQRSSLECALMVGVAKRATQLSMAFPGKTTEHLLPMGQMSRYVFASMLSNELSCSEPGTFRLSEACVQMDSHQF